MKIFTSINGKNRQEAEKDFMRTIDQKALHYCRSAEIVELVNAFEDCTLPPEKLTQEVYLTLIFWHLFFNSSAEAKSLIHNSLRRYCFEHNIASTGTTGDNETLMIFWLEKASFYLENFGAKLSFLELANGLILNFKENSPSNLTTANGFLQPEKTAAIFN